MTLRAVLALLLKDAWHHVVAFAGFLVLGLAALVLTFGYALGDDSGSLLSAATGLVWGAGPLLTLAVTRRLFVVERLDASHAFLAVLPTSPLRVGAVRWIGGMAGVIAWAWVNLAVVALAVHRQELLAPAWLLQVACQCAAYVAAWFALGFALAQLGRWRFAAWIVLFLTLNWADSHGAEHFGWDAALADPIERARYAPPWREIGVTLGWAVGATIAGLALLGWRHGDLVDRAWTPMTTRGRAGIFAGIVAYMAVLEVVAQQLPSPGAASRFASVPAVASSGATVRVGGDPALRETAQALATDLDDLGDWLDVDAWPEVVLLPAEPGAAAAVVPIQTSPLVLRVDPSASRPRVREQLLHRVLSQSTGGQLDDDDPRAWVVAGAAWWWIERSHPEDVVALRASWAASQGLGPRDLERWGATRGRLGPEVTDAIAWAGVSALSQTAGEDGAQAFLREALAPKRPGTFTTLLDRWRSPSPPDPDAHRAAWLARLAELRDENAAAVAPIAPLDLDLAREVDEQGRSWLTWTWRSEPRPGAVLRWYAMADLVIVPTEAWPETEDAPADAREGRVGLDVDPRDAVAATVVLYSDELDAELISGWRRLSP